MTGFEERIFMLMAGKTNRLADFTLIELLLIVTIIMVLISVLLPALRQSREKAREIKCASVERNVNQYLMFYANDYNGWYPQHWDGSWTYQKERMWCDLISKLYTSDSNVYKFRSVTARCPSVVTTEISAHSYALRQNMILSGHRADKITKPSRFLLLIESDTYNFPPEKGAAPYLYASFRHLGWMNLLLMDGHVARYKQEIFSTASAIYVDYY